MVVQSVCQKTKKTPRRIRHRRQPDNKNLLFEVNLKTMKYHLSNPFGLKSFVTSFSIVLIIFLQLLSNSAIAQNEFLIIGDEDIVEGKENGQEYLLGWIYDAEVDSSGNIFIYDYQSKSLKKFSREGVFITQIGRQGNGPGEYIGLSKIESDGVNNLFLLNSRKNILQYDLDGNFIKEIDYMTHHPNMFDFEYLEPNRLLMFGFRNDKNDWFNNVFCSINIDTGEAIDFGELPRIQFSSRNLKRFFSDNTRAERQLYTGRIAIQPNSSAICYSPWYDPGSIYIYSYGNNSPTKVIRDNSYPEGLQEKPLTKKDRKIRLRAESQQDKELFSSQTSMGDCYVIGNCFYHLILDHASKEILIQGYDLKTEKNVFTAHIQGDSSGSIPFEFLDLDQKMNAYFSCIDPYPRLIRVKLRNKMTIDLTKLK